MDKMMNRNEIKLRPAILYDSLIMYKWVMDPESRSNSIKGELFSFKHHFRWLKEKLKSDDCKLFILESKFPIGQIRFEKKDDMWILSYSIDENFRKQGMGQLIVEMGLEKMGRGTYLAKVKKNNIPSIKIFSKLNFVIITNINDGDDIINFLYKKE